MAMKSTEPRPWPHHVSRVVLIYILQVFTIKHWQTNCQLSHITHRLSTIVTLLIINNSTRPAW